MAEPTRRLPLALCPLRQSQAGGGRLVRARGQRHLRRSGRPAPTPARRCRQRVR